MENKKYKIVYADPPWSYNVWSTDKTPLKNNMASKYYPTMSIPTLKKLPVGDLVKDGVLFLWTTFPQLPVALEVMKSWGFKYKTIGFVWIKTCKDSNKLIKGCGYWTRANAEICLIGCKGENYPRRINKGVQQVIIQPRRKHSQKPDVARERIVELMGNLPRIELFARNKSLGWDVWGNEVQNDIELEMQPKGNVC